jgi:hypothetical protein
MKSLAGTSWGETEVYIIVKEHNKQQPIEALYRLHTQRKKVIYVPHDVPSS